MNFSSVGKKISFKPDTMQFSGTLMAVKILEEVRIEEYGPSGNRTRVLGFEAQEDILYPMDPSFSVDIKRY